MITKKHLDLANIYSSKEKYVVNKLLMYQVCVTLLNHQYYQAFGIVELSVFSSYFNSVIQLCLQNWSYWMNLWTIRNLKPEFMFTVSNLKSGYQDFSDQYTVMLIKSFKDVSQSSQSLMLLPECQSSQLWVFGKTIFKILKIVKEPLFLM